MRTGCKGWDAATARGCRVLGTSITPSGCFNCSVFQNHLQRDLTKATVAKQPPSLLKEHFLAVPNLDKPPIIEFLGLGGSWESSISFMDEVLNPAKHLALFKNPIGNSHRNLI